MEETLLGLVFIVFLAWVSGRCLDSPYLRYSMVIACVVVALLLVFGGLAGLLWGMVFGPVIAVAITIVLWAFFGIRP
jgi:hypothetical protein